MSIAIISPVKDFLFFFLSSAVVLVAWAASTQFHVEPFFILATVAAVSNGPHLVSTWTRVYFDRRELTERPFAIIVMPLLILAGVLTLTITAGYTGTRVLNSIILYWATWHFVAQNWGILRIYQRKSGEPMNALALQVEKPLLLLFVLFCLLWRLYEGPRVLFGTEVFFIAPPKIVVLALLGPIAGLLAIVLVQRLRTRNAPYAKAAWVRFAFLGCAFIGFFVPFFMMRTDDTSAFAAAACWHGFQYLGIVRAYHRNAWRSGVTAQAPIVSWLAQPGWSRALLYCAFLGVLAGGVYGIIYAMSFVTRGGQWDFNSWAGIIWVSLTLSHYWLDGVIWKLRRPEIAARVGLVPTT